MAYTFGRETVRVDRAVLWIAECICPEASKLDQRKTEKRVLETIQYAFLRHLLPGSEGIRATKKGRLPNGARLKAPEFFTWAAERWPVLREQEGIPFAPNVGHVSSVAPLPKLTALTVDTPQDLAELQKKHIAAETKAFLLQQENDALRVENDSLKKQIEEFEKEKARTFVAHSNAGKKSRGKKKPRS